MTVPYNKFNTWINYLIGNVPANIVVWSAAGDAIQVGLSNSAPDGVNLQTYSTTNITELATGNGYTQGGVTCTTGAMAYSAGTVSFPLTMPTTTWTSSVGSMGPFRYIEFWDTTRTNKPMIGYYDYGVGGLTLNGANGDTFAVSLTGGNLFSIA